MMERPEPLHGEYRLGGDPCYRCLKRENEALRAAIARVRELCDESDRNRPRIDGYRINRTVPVKDIRRALDGE